MVDQSTPFFHYLVEVYVSSLIIYVFRLALAISWSIPVFSQNNSIDGATWAEVFRLDEAEFGDDLLNDVTTVYLQSQVTPTQMMITQTMDEIPIIATRIITKLTHITQAFKPFKMQCM